MKIPGILLCFISLGFASNCYIFDDIADRIACQEAAHAREATYQQQNAVLQNLWDQSNATQAGLVAVDQENVNQGNHDSPRDYRR